MALLVSSTSPQAKQRKSLRLSLPWGKLRKPFFVLLLILLVNGFGADQAQAQSKEYQIKAAFLFNFAQFVKWPGTSFPTPDAPFCIGILGDDPFGGALEETIQGETIDNRKLTLQHARNFEELQGCQMIFVSKSEESHVGQILSQLDSKPILLVSDINSFAKSGGAIGFYLQEGKVRFAINPSTAQRGGLRVSSQLLNLGKIVGGN